MLIRFYKAFIYYFIFYFAMKPKTMIQKIFNYFILFLAVLFLVLSIIGFILPVIPGSLFFVLSILFFLIILPGGIKELPGLRFLLSNKKKFGTEEFRMKLFAFLTIKVLFVFLLISIWLQNYEFIYYNLILLPLVFLIYLVHKRLILHLPIFILICGIFLLHAAGGSIFIQGLRLYDLTFWFIKYDNIIHFLGSFVIVFVTYNIFYNYINDNKKYSSYYLFLILVFVSAGFGTLIEMVELNAVIFFDAGEGVGGYFNNAIDLLANLLGAIAASLIVVKVHRNRLFKEGFMKGKTSKFFRS